MSKSPNEEAQEASECRPAPPARLDELGFESLSWCVWGEKCYDPVEVCLYHSSMFVHLLLQRGNLLVLTGSSPRRNKVQ